jgi:RES domain-containing protein
LIIVAWRISRAEHAAQAFEGRGAERFGGRWNSRGIRMVYTANSQALAVLELLAHLNPPEILGRYRLIPVEFDEAMVYAPDPKRLPADWKRRPVPRSTRALGDAWVESARLVVMRVPSVIVPAERNYLLNPSHPEFRKLVIGKPVPFHFDQRLR